MPIEQTVLQSILKVKKPSVGNYSMSISQNATAHRIWMNRSLLVIGQRFLSVSVDLVVENDVSVTVRDVWFDNVNVLYTCSVISLVFCSNERSIFLNLNNVTRLIRITR